MIADNGWYGHRRVLSDYCEMPAERPIWGAIRHGWSEDVEPVGRRRRLVDAPVFYWNDRHVAQARRTGVSDPRCVGAPFVYAVDNLGVDSMSTGTGTLVFHAHSAEDHRVEQRYPDLARRVVDVAEPPFTLAVYYQDWSPRVEAWCASADWRCVTFGPRSDRRFLYRAVSELSRHAGVVTEGFQTATWYGAFLGRRITVLADDSSIERIKDPSRRVIMNRLRRGIGPDEGRMIGEAELGVSRKLKPSPLKDQLGWSSEWLGLKARALSLAADLRFGRALRQGIVTDRNVSHLRRRNLRARNETSAVEYWAGRSGSGFG